jgi:hypothetical protein
MKALLALTVVLSMSVPALIAGDTKACDQAKACDKAKATECSKAKDSCCAKEAAAIRQALLRHKGAYIAQR